MTPEQLNQYQEERRARENRRKRASDAAKVKRMFASIKPCEHKKTELVTSPAEEVDGRALDEITELRCTGCKKLMGLLV